MNIPFVPANEKNYKKGRSDSIKFIVIHYTANNGDTAKNNVDYYKNNAVEASAHYFVDESEIYQSVKDGDTAWAVGAKSYKHPTCRNANSISIEMCSRNVNGSGKGATDAGWYFKNETIENAQKLTKELMAKYKIPPENVLRHFDVTGKICPAPFVNNPSLWENFKTGLTYFPKSYDKTVDNMISDGVTTTENMAYWEKVLSGRAEVDLNYLRTILDRYHERGL